jgi:tetratricopeptide (TPR) repeat protein
MLLLKKFRLFWHFVEIPQIYNYTLLKESLPLLRAPLLSFLIISPLALAGIGLVLVRRKDPARVLAAAAGLYILSLLPFFITGRYRLPLVPLLIIFAAYAVTTLVECVRSRNYKTAGIIIAVLLVLPLTFTGFRQQVEPFERSQFFNSVGLACKGAGDTAGAEDSFRRALQDDPRNPFILANLGQLLAERDDDTGAINCYDQALQQNPGSTDLLFLRVQACARAGEVDKAIESCHRLLELDPEFYQASFGLVGFHLSKGEHTEAAAAFRDYARLRPDDLQSRFNLTDHLVSVGQLDLAGELLTEGLTLAPGAAPLHGRLGEVSLKQGRPEEARRHLEEALRLDPNHEPAQILLQRFEGGE